MMTPRLQFAAIAMAALTIAGAAQAQSTKKDLVARVVALQQASIDGVARNIAGQTAQQVLQAAGNALGGVPADKREAVAKDVQADIKRFFDEIEPILRDRAAKIAPTAMGPLLEEKMSEDELKQLVAWLESPAAKKFNEVGPNLLTSLQEKLVADTKPTVEPKLRTLEETLRKKLNPEGGAAAPAPAKPASKAAPAKK